MIKIKRNSPTHVALCYLKTKTNKWSVPNDLIALSPAKYEKKPSKALRSLETLVAHGFACCSEKGYTITEQGRKALYQIVAEQPSRVIQ